MSAGMSIENALALAIERHNAGDLVQAENLYRQILSQDSNHSDALHLLGLIAQRYGKFDAALELIKHAISIAPAAMYYSNVAELYRLLGKSREAEEAARKAINLEPNFIPAHVNLAVILIDSQRFSDAEAVLNHVVSIERSPMALTMLANLRFMNGDCKEAIALGRQAIEAAPNVGMVHNNLGAALEGDGQIVEAEAAYRRAVELAPNSPEFMNNHGTALRKLGDIHQAMDVWTRAIQERPDYPDANWNMSLAHLALGEYERGWPMYEWRFRYAPGRPMMREYPAPRWHGFDLKGKRILLYPEQGYGDVIMFVRYVPLLAKMGAIVILHVPKEMIDLLRGVEGVAEILPLEQAPPPIDTYQPLMTLPSVFKTKLSTIPAEVPYIKIDPARREKWSKRMAGAKGKKVGIVWAGRPSHPEDRNRSISAEMLAPLMEIEGLTFYSLQMGEAADRLSKVPALARVIDLKPDIQDFADSGAAIEQLDLLITVDTAAAHIAGALAKPVWTLIAFLPDFRWLMEREDSPWYPTMRLLRQKTRGDWADVLAQLEANLKKFAAE